MESKLSENIRQLKILSKELFGDLEDTNLFTLKFHMLDHIVEDVARFENLNILDAFPYEHFNFILKTFSRMTSMRRGSTLDEAVELINSSVTNDDFSRLLEGEIRAAKLVRDGITTTLADIETSTYSSLAHLDKNARCVLTSQCLEIVQNSFQKISYSFLLAEISITIVKSRFIHGVADISLDSYDEQSGRIKKDVQFLASVQRVYADVAFGPSKAERFSVVLVESDGGDFWFSRVMLLFHLRTRSKTEMSGEFALIQYFEITSPIDSVDRVLRCLCLRWATDDEVDLTVNENLSSADIIEVGEWYGVVPFSSVRSVHHIVRSNYCVSSFTSPLPWPLHRFYVNRFHQPRI